MTKAIPIRTQASPAQERLSDALTNVQIAMEAVSGAEQIATRAIADLNQAGETLKSFAGLDKRILGFRVDALKKGGWTGWPADLQAERLEKLAAVEECEHAAAAAQTLNGELETARENLEAAERQFDQAALDVFFEAVTQVVAQLDELNRQRAYLTCILKGISLPAAPPFDWQRLSPAQRNLILGNNSGATGFLHGDTQRWEVLHCLASEAVYPAAVPELPNAINTAATYWKAFAKNLHQDPGAMPGPLPSRDSILA